MVLKNQVTSTQWVIPYVDQPLGFWEDLYHRYGNSIRSVYLAHPDLSIGSGRPIQPHRHIKSFLDSRIFPITLLINPIILRQPAETFKDQVVKLISFLLKHNTLHDVTLTSIHLAKIIRAHFPSLSLTASTLADIHSVQQLAYIEGIFDVIVPSTRIIRNIKALRELRNDYSGKIRLMVNEGCLANCIFRIQHFYEMQCPEIDYPQSLCSRLLEEKPWLRLTSSWILPQHLYFFEGLYDELKLAGRVSLQNPAIYHQVFSHYIQQNPLLPNQIGGGPAAMLQPMDIDPDFYQTTLNCMKNCSQCSICSDYWKGGKIFD